MFTIENWIATVKINHSHKTKENGIQNIVAKYFYKNMNNIEIEIQNVQNKKPKPDSQQSHIGAFTI